MHLFMSPGALHKSCMATALWCTIALLSLKSAKLTETCDRMANKGHAAVLCVGHAAIPIKSMKSVMRPDNSVAFLEETLQNWGHTLQVAEYKVAGINVQLWQAINF